MADRAGRAVELRGAPLSWRVAIAAAAVALSTGAGLVAYFISGLSLPVGIGLAFALTATVGAVVWRRLDSGQRSMVRRRARAGLLAGLAATVAYDACRFLIVTVFHLSVAPWAALPLFGQLLTAQPPDTPTAFAVGLVYHVANGVCFAIAYAMLAASRGVLAGMAFALALEALMLTFYPGWLDVRAIGEFFSMTILGHVAYGATLGWLTQRLMTR